MEEKQVLLMKKLCASIYYRTKYAILYLVHKFADSRKVTEIFGGRPASYPSLKSPNFINECDV